MAAKQESCETKAAESNTKKGFDRQILKEYVNVFKGSQKRPDGNRKPEYEIWEDLCQQLGLSEAAQRRYLKGVDKVGAKPVSLLDGQVEGYEPGLDEVFRYIAARDQFVEFPRGRVIVNRVVVRALRGIRKAYTGQIHHLAPLEVERLRFLRHWNYLDRNYLRVARSGFSVEVVRAMGDSEFCDLMGPLEQSDRFVAALNRLWNDWNVAMTELINQLSYDWLR
jgi:hypothetical protein